jgi:NAD(P)-dependent dehydrogenase (short-subunit alcohol dehydrogenase family)
MVRCTKAFLPILKRQSIHGLHKGGRILNVASMAGKVVGFGLATAYNASKHAAVAFSHGLRIDMAPFGIQVCTICPSFHGTPIVDTMSEKLKSYWMSLPKEVCAEYGDEFFNFLSLQSRLPQCFTWRMETVIEGLMDLLSSRTVPAEYIVGSDARFGLSLLRMVPHWIVDVIFRYVPPRPLPACRQSKIEEKA